MFLTVAPSLAVYGGSAALLLYLAHRFVLPLSRRMALVLAVAPLLFTGRAMLTGGVYAPIDVLYNAMPFGAHRNELGVAPDRTPLLSDVVYQQIPWRSAVRRALARGDFPLWNPDVLAGEPLAAVQQSAVLYPGTWIGLLLPLPQAWTFDMTLRLLIALVCAYLFLRDLWCCEMAALLGSLGWAFSNWLVFYLGVPPMPAVAPFPLLLLGLRRIAGEPDRRGAAITVAALLLVVTAGHPETLLHECAGAGLYFLFELVSAGKGRRLRAVFVALGSGAVAMGLSAVLLLPLAEALPHTQEYLFRTSWYARQSRSVTPTESIGRLVPQVMPYAVGVSGHGRLMDGFIEPSAYAGALLLPFAFAGLFSRSRSRWMFAVLGILGLLVGTRTALAGMLAKLPLFDIALNDRLMFLTTLSTCVLAALGANRLRDGEGAAAFLVGAAGSLLLLAWLFARFRARMAGLELPAAEARERLLLQVAPLALAIAVIAFLSRPRRASAGLAALVAIFAVERTLEAGGVYPTMPEPTFYPPQAVLEKIPRGVPYRIAGVGRALLPNVSAVYGLEDVRGYEAMTLLPFWETYPLWCVPQPVWSNRIDDPMRPFLSFLNVRWVLTELAVPPPAGWPVLAESDGLRLLENPRALPRAFSPRLVRAERDPGRRLKLLESIEDFGERGVIETDDPPGLWTDNGAARVTMLSYRAQAMELDVEARAETLVATSLTGWSGWRAELDGQELPAIRYNHAFLAFRVPSGRHRLSLRYASDAFRSGALVSLASLALTALILFRPRPGKLGDNPR